jgi:hypothetical protein
VWNMETPTGSSTPMLCAGKPTVTKAQFPGGNRMPKKRMPAAERRRKPRTWWLQLQAAVLDNRPDTRRPGAVCAGVGWLRKQADVRQVSR